MRQALPIDLGYQDFEAELARAAGEICEPDRQSSAGARRKSATAGLRGAAPIRAGRRGDEAALRGAGGRAGWGLGRALVAAVIEAARRLGLWRDELDTLPGMTAALALYRAAGFAEVPAYYDTPVADTIFMAKRL